MRAGRSLKWQLTALCIGLLLPTLAFVGVLLWQVAVSERSRVEEQARDLSQGLAAALDREMNGVLATLQALATSPSLQTRDLAAFYSQAMEIRRLQGIHISLRSVEGYTVLTTRAPLGAAVPVPPLLAETDREILRSGMATVSNVFASATSGGPVFQIVTAPVMAEGKRAFLLAASIDVGYLANVMRSEILPRVGSARSATATASLRSGPNNRRRSPGAPLRRHSARTLARAAAAITEPTRRDTRSLRASRGPR